MRSNRSTSAGVWLTTLSSCLCDHTSVGSGATLRSPTRIMRLVRLPRMDPNQASMASRKSSLWRNFGLSVGSGKSPPAGTYTLCRTSGFLAARELSSRWRDAAHDRARKCRGASPMRRADAKGRQRRDSPSVRRSPHGQTPAPAVVARGNSVDAFNLLQAEDVWLMRSHEALDQIESQPDRVDVPRREAKTHEDRPKKKGAQPLRVVGRQKRVFCARVPGGKPARADHIFG